MLQKLQCKSHLKKKEFNVQALLKYTTFISKFSEKIGECDNFFIVLQMPKFH